MSEEKHVSETVRASSESEAVDLAHSGCSNENVQTNGIPDDRQSVSSTDNLVNNFHDYYISNILLLGRKDKAKIILMLLSCQFGLKKNWAVQVLCNLYCLFQLFQRFHFMVLDLLGNRCTWTSSSCQILPYPAKRCLPCVPVTVQAFNETPW